MLKQMPTLERTRSLSAFTLIILAFTLLGALVLSMVEGCGGTNAAPASQNSAQPTTAPSAGGAPTVGSPPSAGSGQVVITGAINQRYTVRTIMANKLPGDIRIFLDLEPLCDIVIDVPFNTEPGTYPIAAESKSSVVFAQYDDTCHTPEFYPSTKGTLTLTATGAKLSGTFEFTGQNNQDKSKTIQVSGSFSDVPVQ